MTHDSVQLLVLAGGVLTMMITLAVLKHAAKNRATAARRAHHRLRARGQREARSDPFAGP